MSVGGSGAHRLGGIRRDRDQGLHLLRVRKAHGSAVGVSSVMPAINAGSISHGTQRGSSCCHDDEN